jgi:hypothetical protein
MPLGIYCKTFVICDIYFKSLNILSFDFSSSINKLTLLAFDKVFSFFLFLLKFV